MMTKQYRTPFGVRCTSCRRMIGPGDLYERIEGEKGSFHPKCVEVKLPKVHIPHSPVNPPQRQAIKVQYDVKIIKSLPASSSSKPQTGSSQFQIPSSASDQLICPDGLSYLPYQVEGIRRMLGRVQNGQSTLLGDEMGLGKTIQAIGLINQLPSLSSIAIVCPASLRINWFRELTTWLVKTPSRIIDYFPESYLHENNISIIPYSFLEIVPTSYKPQFLIVDEAHYVKNPEAMRTRALKNLARRSENLLFMTGSPIENRVRELWTLLQLLDPETWDPGGFLNCQLVKAGEGAGWIKFAKRHCGGRLVEHGWGKKNIGRPKKHFVFDGSTHLEELNRKLRETVLIRRLKADVLTDLPEKRRQVIILPTPPILKDGLIHLEHQAFVKAGLDYETDIKTLNKKSIEFNELAAARKSIGLAKVPFVVEHIANCFDSGTKALVVLAHHKEVVWQIADMFPELQPAVITGDCSEILRDNAVQRFQAEETKLFVGTIGAAGVGLTLTAASHGIFAELEWKDLSQAEDRLHRIGQKEAVLWQSLIFDWSVDANMIKLLWKKKEIIQKALG